MKDVAFRARVALKTVSRVVNGEPGVTPETTARVLGAIEELGFRRNESARLLRTGKTATIGFIFDSWGYRENASLGQGIEEVARERGFLIFAGSTDSDPERERRLTLSLCARRVHGLVIVPASGAHEYMIPEMDAGIAAVFALRPPSHVAADAALVDEEDAARTAVAYLAAHGHRRIGFLGGDRLGYQARELLRGYRAAMASAGLGVDEAWTALEPQNLADSAVTAVLCGSREDTALALHSLMAPEGSREVAVIGYGDFDLMECPASQVTVINYDYTEVGRKAAELLFARIGGYDGPPRQVRVRATLIPHGPRRNSTASQR